MTDRVRHNVWALTDDRPGNTAQVLGVTDALSVDEDWVVEEKAVRYTGWARLPNIVRPAKLAAITGDSQSLLLPPWPDVVITAGRRAAPVARWIKHQSGGKTILAQIMLPGRIAAGDFDIIAVPDHDSNGLVKAWPNVVSITGAPTRITEALLAQERQRWKGHFDALQRPYIAVMVGGSTRRRPFSRKRAVDLGFRVAELSKQSGGSVLLTTSRRTGRKAEMALMQVVPEPRSVHVWQPDGDNPYLGMLALADAIVVTGDSVTMCAEACATSVPVYIDAPPRSVSAKHARLHQQFYDLGYAKPLGTRFEAWTHTPHNPAGDIAEAIRRAALC